MHERFQYILVDEFQDTNEVQYEIIKKLFHKSLFVIGDPRQSIYSFRGAGADMFSRITHDFPYAETISLPTNYRSAKRIIHVSSLLFPHDETLTPHRQAPGLVQQISSLNEFAEADYIIRTINQYVGGTDLLEAANISDHTQNLSFSDFAVIYRNHHVSKVIQERLFDSGIPFQAIAAESPYAQLEVQFLADCLNYFYDRSDQNLSKILRYPFIISRNHIKVIFESNTKTTKPSVLMQKLVQHFRLLEKLKDKREEIRNLVQFQNSLTQFDSAKNGIERAVKYLQYLGEREYYDPSCDTVTLLTMHASKGLEFRVVFICGFEEGIIPPAGHHSQLDEEKRLLYVALTRAKDTLYLTSSQNRNKKAMSPSSFLKLIACEELVQMEDEANETIKKKIEKAKIKKSQMKMF
jgi:superfamily I DNA/RNA helicase